MPADLFAPANAAWTARPSDPNDVLLAQLVRSEREPARVVLFGVPFDGAVIGRPGARAGPDAIRAEMARLKPWTLAHGDLAIGVADWGNVRIPYGDVAVAHAAIERAASAVAASGALPLALGGDHSITFPLVRGLLGTRPGLRLGVVNLDAHLDVRDVVGGALNSGQSFGRLLESGLVDGRRLVEVGVRDFANASAYAAKARKHGVTIVGAAEWRERGLDAIARAVDVASDGADGVYLSLDVDVLDQAFAPGVSAPTPGGVDTSELYAALRLIASRAPLVGADVVEVAPPLDRDGMTSRAAAHAVMHVVAAIGALHQGRVRPDRDA